MRYRTGMVRRPPGRGRRAGRARTKARARRGRAGGFWRWPRRWLAVVRWFVLRPLRLLWAQGWRILAGRRAGPEAPPAAGERAHRWHRR